MTKEEWIIEFKVLNGRAPSPAELVEAEQNHFQAGAKLRRKIRITPALFLKIGILLLLAVFGYIVGYLFA